MPKTITESTLDLPRFWIQPYYKSFNGLRGFAVLMVFVSHYASYTPFPWLKNWTWEGVDLFFVLSGFLITGILYDARHDLHFFRNFYVRRALRIFPIFYGFFLLLLLFTPILRLHYHRSILFFVFYVGNLALPFLNIVTNNPTTIAIIRHGHMDAVANIGHLWSLCVEEQFYLIWPAVVYLVRDRKRLMQLCSILIVATVSGRFYLWSHASQAQISKSIIFWSTYTRCDTILIGAWMALWLRGNALSIRRLRLISSALICGSVFVILVGALHSTPYRSLVMTHFMSTTGFTLVALAAAGITLGCLDEDSLFARFFQIRQLSALGTISYGFYFFQGLERDLWRDLQSAYPGLTYVVPLLAFGLTLGIATLSFRYFESPFLRLKKVLAPQEVSHATSRLHVPEPEPAQQAC